MANYTIKTCYDEIIIALDQMTECYDKGYNIDAVVFYATAKRLMDIYITLED